MAYLTGITVEGFRGIGERRTLELRPGPGLTVVIGRNGSGKSSFAEAVEVALTGSLRRWDDATSVVWRQGWRNLHHQSGCEVVVGLSVEGHPGATVVRRRWTSDKLDEGVTVVQVAGEKQSGIGRLGWGRALSDYRPFLSHSELETMLAKPSDLFEKLALVLGLDDLVGTGRRLADALKLHKQVAATAKKELPSLLDRLRTLDDERAQVCVTALEGRKWDLDAAERVSTGRPDQGEHAAVTVLRAVAGLRAPAGELVAGAAGRLRAAGDALVAASTAEAANAERLAGLLTAALSHHEHHGDGDCPVCGRPEALDLSWRASTGAEADRLRAVAARLREARAESTEAAHEARLLVDPAPPVLQEAAAVGLAVDDASMAWSAWAAPPSGDGSDGMRALAKHLESRWADLAASVEDLSERAAAEASSRDEAWSPVAGAVAAWCASAQRSLAAQPVVKRLKEADAWLKAVTEDLRNQRLRPLATNAGQVWAGLRQESNVELGAIRLAGTATRRRVELDVKVDGVGGAALGVMSQGEVNALALSIFIPRATLPASPFGFLVIDDPVQAMDPAKVEGLARVLEDTARTRQVIVFTHDDRLPSAIRRLAVDAVVMEVTRRPGSIVDLQPSDDPSSRSLRQAQGLCLDEALPPQLLAKVVPGLCRTAVESVLMDGALRQLLGRGERHAEVERRIDEARSLTERAALALFGDGTRGGDVYGRLNTHGRWAADTFRACNEGAHGSFVGDPSLLVENTRRLVTKLRQVLG
jgi:energy-coupling factor transporter ATP-binding protein EcfA2